MEGTCWSPSNCSQMSLQQCNKEDSWILGQHHMKIIMITDVSVTYSQKRQGMNFLHTSVNFTVLTQCHTNGPYKEGDLHKSAVLLPLPSNAAYPLRWRISPFNDASSHLLTDSNKSQHYYIQYCHQDWVPVSLTALSTTPKANSTTAAYNNTERYNTLFI